jgi:protease-4
MRQFFKFMLASMLGTFLVGAILIFILIGTIAAMATMAGSGKSHAVKDNSVLRITFDKEIKDRGNKDDLDLDFGPFSGNTHIGLNTILASLENAKTDDKIKGIYLDLVMVNAGFGSLKEIRDKIIEFKQESGKPVIAHSEFYTQAAYYLATAADDIYLQPKGDVDYRGLASEPMFLKGLFEKLEIDIQLVRGSNNKFKAFGETFTEDKMSEPNREQIRMLLKDFWNEHLAAVSTSRNVSIDRLNVIADSMLVRSDISAAQLNFITGAKYHDEVHTIMRERMGLDADKKIEFADLKDYSKSFSHPTKNPKDKTSTTSGKNKLAVIYAEGSIASGEDEDGTIGSTSLGETLRDVREDDDVKAVVFRVNSPGGSALASEIIWREVKLIAEKKPIVVSMGDVAASGGYYISAPATKIYAQPTTITGSIGVFGMIPNMQGFFNNKLGITFDVEKTHKYADMLTVSRALSDEELRIIQLYVDDIYGTFKERVAEGRRLSVEMVDSIGQGRVWSGTEAKRLGLVDEMGGLEEAIAEAARLAELGDDYKQVELPEQKDFLEKLMEDLNANAKIWAATQVLGTEDLEMLSQYKRIQEAKKSFGIQARMPYDLTIR